MDLPATQPMDDEFVSDESSKKVKLDEHTFKLTVENLQFELNGSLVSDQTPITVLEDWASQFEALLFPLVR